MNDASVIHFSKVLEVLGGLLLPGKNINNSFAGGGRKIAEEHILLGIVGGKYAHNISCSVTNISGFESNK